MFGATSNNPARMAARSYGRALTIDKYDTNKAAENKEWIAKYGYKRWGMSYVDKSSLEVEKGSAPAAAPSSPAKVSPPPLLLHSSVQNPLSKPAPVVLTHTQPAAPKVSMPSFSFGGGAPKAAAAAPSKPKSAVRVTAAPKAAAPAPAAKPVVSAPAKPAAPTGPLAAAPPKAQGSGNLNLLKKPGL